MIRKIFECLISIIKRFFSSKAGKIAAGTGAAVGVAAAVDGSVKVVRAKKTNKLAEGIRASAIKDHDEGKQKTDKALEELGETELSCIRSFSVFSDMIEQIHSRPEFHVTIPGVSLPPYNPAEYKQMNACVELAIGSAGGTLAGAAIGVAAMGAGVLALGPGVLVGGVVLCVMGNKMVKQSAENLKQARQMKKDVDRIIEFYAELRSISKKLNESIKAVNVQYDKHLKKAQHIVSKKTDWRAFSEKECRIVENTIMLVGCLHKMCKINLVVREAQPTAIEAVNRADVERTKAEATIVLDSLRKANLPA